MKDYSEETADEIDKEVKEIMEACYKKAKEILSLNRDKLDQIAKVLIEKETLEGEDLEAVFPKIKT